MISATRAAASFAALRLRPPSRSPRRGRGSRSPPARPCSSTAPAARRRPAGSRGPPGRGGGPGAPARGRGGGLVVAVRRPGGGTFVRLPGGRRAPLPGRAVALAASGDGVVVAVRGSDGQLRLLASSAAAVAPGVDRQLLVVPAAGAVDSLV